MYSPLYSYYLIYSDSNLKQFYDAGTLKIFLKDIPELKEDGPNHFVNAQGSSFISISLLSAKSIDSWSSQKVELDAFNLISVIGTRNEDDEDTEELLIQIADFLGWQWVDESKPE